MRFREFGSKKNETIILLHGGGLSWWNYRTEAELLQSDYHIVLPVLDGHAGSDRTFTSIESNAEELIKYIDANCGGRVLMIGGLSLGAQILLEVLSQRSDICRYAIVESASVIPSKTLNMLIGSTFGVFYGLIKNKLFAKLQFRSLHIKQDLFEDYYRDTCKITKEDYIAFLKANTAYSLKKTIADTTACVHVIAGDKETGVIKRSANIFCNSIADCKVIMLPDLFHGEFSLNYPDRYVEFIKQCLIRNTGDN